MSKSKCSVSTAKRWTVWFVKWRAIKVISVRALAESVRNFETIWNPVFREYRNARSNAVNWSNQIDEKNRILFEKFGTLQSKILKRAAEIKEIIDEHTNKLLRDIEFFKRENLKKLEIRKDEVRSQLTMLGSYKRYVEEVILKGSSVDICRNFQDMTVRANQLERKPY